MRRTSDFTKIHQFQFAFNKVFQNKDPFGELFTDSIGERLLLCPTNGFYLDEDQFNALIKTISYIGESNFILSEIEGECFSQPISETDYEHGHWEVTLPISYSDYQKAVLVVENAIYSQSGRWGVMISHEDHAIIGGTNEFIEKFKKCYPNWTDGINNFKAKWEYNKKHYDSNLEWIPMFLDHINK